MKTKSIILFSPSLFVFFFVFFSLEIDRRLFFRLYYSFGLLLLLLLLLSRKKKTKTKGTRAKNTLFFFKKKSRRRRLPNLIVGVSNKKGKVFSTTQKNDIESFWICFYDTHFARAQRRRCISRFGRRRRRQRRRQRKSFFLLCIYTVDVLEYY